MMRPWFFFLLVLSGCMVGPDYKPPEILVSDTWNAEETTKQPEITQKWWEVFGDDLLTKYISLAAVQNYDIQTASIVSRSN